MEFALTHPDTGLKHLLIIYEGVPYEVDSDHPWWKKIVHLTLNNDPHVIDLLTIIPSRKIEPDEDGAAQAFKEYFDSRGIDPMWMGQGDYTEEELRDIRAIFDRFGFDTCDDDKCLYCHGDRHYSQEKNNDNLRNERDLLESAVRTYASHIWNDIKRKLSEING